MGKIILGVETLRCPRCGRPNQVEVHSDLPDRDYLSCRFCGYRAKISFAPILDKFGLPHGLSQDEKWGMSRYIKTEIDKIQ